MYLRHQRAKAKRQTANSNQSSNLTDSSHGNLDTDSTELIASSNETPSMNHVTRTRVYTAAVTNPTTRTSATLMALKRGEEGIAAFRRALSFNPALTLARVNLGWALANGGRVTEAIEQFEQARRLYPDSADVEFKWGLTLAMHDRVVEALPHLKRAVELQPADADMRHALGRASLAIGRNDDAVAQFKEALHLNPHHAGARAGLDSLLRGGASAR